jgi:hypothetical protein
VTIPNPQSDKNAGSSAAAPAGDPGTNGHGGAAPALYWLPRQCAEEIGCSEYMLDYQVMTDERMTGQLCRDLRETWAELCGEALNTKVTWNELPVMPASVAGPLAGKTLTRAQAATYAAAHGLEDPHVIAERLRTQGSARQEQMRARVLALFAADPLALSVEKVPPFPMHTLPAVLADMATAVAAAYDVDPAMPAMLALGAMSAALQGRVTIEPYAGFRELAVLYVVTIADSGERKSPVLLAMFTGPIGKVERELVAEHRCEVEQVPIKREDEDGKEETGPVLVAVQVTRGGKPVVDEDGEPTTTTLVDLGAVNTLVARERPECPPPRLVASDITPEKLAVVMDEQDGVMCLADAEGNAFDVMLGLYNPKSSVRLYNMAYTGEAASVDRVGRGSVFLAHPALTVCVATQPSTWLEVMSTTRLLHTGLVPRFAAAYIESRRSRYARRMATPESEREPLGEPVPVEVAAAYTRLIFEIGVHMRGREFVTAGCTEEAQFLVRRYAGIHGELDTRILQDDGDLGGPLRTWAAKSGGRMLRIAAMIHTAKLGAEAYRQLIETDTIEAAIEVEEWLIANTRAAHGLAGAGNDVSAEDLRTFVDWLVREHAKAPCQPITLRRISRNAAPGSIRQASRRETAIELLADLHYLVRTKVGDAHAVYLNPVAADR